MPIVPSETIQAFARRQTPAFQTFLSKWLEELGRPFDTIAEMMIWAHDGLNPQDRHETETGFVDVAFLDRCYDSRRVHLETFELCPSQPLKDPFRLISEHELTNAFYLHECLHGWYVTHLVSAGAEIHIRQFPPEPNRRALVRAGSVRYTLFELERAK